MALFDGHSFCAQCREKGKDQCVESPEAECKFCIVLTPEQKAQLATPSYNLKKEKREAKKLDISTTPSKDGTLVDPATVSVIGAISDTSSVSSPPLTVLRRKQRRTSHLPLSPRNPQKSQPEIRKWRSWIRSGRIDLTVWKTFKDLPTDLFISCEGNTISLSSS